MFQGYVREWITDLRLARFWNPGKAWPFNFNNKLNQSDFIQSPCFTIKHFAR